MKVHICKKTVDEFYLLYLQTLNLVKKSYDIWDVSWKVFQLKSCLLMWIPIEWHLLRKSCRCFIKHILSVCADSCVLWGKFLFPVTVPHLSDELSPARPYKNYLDGQSLVRETVRELSFSRSPSQTHMTSYRVGLHLVCVKCSVPPQGLQRFSNTFFSHLTPHLKYFWNWARYKHPQKEL